MPASAHKIFDLAIVGGGILGTFHAYHALLQGLKVVLFEKTKKAQEATVRNFGQIVPSGMNLKWQAFGRESLRIYKELQAKVDLSVRQEGSIYLASNEEEMTLLEELKQINQANDYPSELWTAKKCLQYYPGLKKTYCKGGLFFPEEITVDPRVLIHRVQSYLIEHLGLVFKNQTPIREVTPLTEACELIDHQGQSYRAAKVVICNGSDFSSLFPQVFAESDLMGVKLQMLQTVPLKTQGLPGSILTGLSIRRYESFSECPSYSAIKKREPQHSLAKDYGVHILFKQAADGSVIIGDSHEYAAAASIEDLGFDQSEAINAFMLAEAKKIFDLESWQLQRQWYGIYSQCKSTDIFLKTISKNIFIVTGIGGKGMTASPGFTAYNLKHSIL